MSKCPRRIAADLLPDEPSDLEPDADEPADSSDLEYEDVPCTDDGDESRWDAFIPDEDEYDPEPDPGDFWIGNLSLGADLAAPAEFPAWC